MLSQWHDLSLVSTECIEHIAWRKSAATVVTVHAWTLLSDLAQYTKCIIHNNVMPDRTVKKWKC